MKAGGVSFLIPPDESCQAYGVFHLSSCESVKLSRICPMQTERMNIIRLLRMLHWQVAVDMFTPVAVPTRSWVRKRRDQPLS